MRIHKTLNYYPKVLEDPPRGNQRTVANVINGGAAKRSAEPPQAELARGGQTHLKKAGRGKYKQTLYSYFLLWSIKECRDAHEIPSFLSGDGVCQDAQSVNYYHGSCLHHPVNHFPFESILPSSLGKANH